MAAAAGAQLAAKGISALRGRHRKKVMHRRRHRYLPAKAKEELEWVKNHLGKTAAAERMAHFR
jgi:hypothetical protein